jgi:hypothetical protein
MFTLVSRKRSSFNFADDAEKIRLLVDAEEDDV